MARWFRHGVVWSAVAAAVVLAAPASAAAATGSGHKACIARHPNYVENTFEVNYAPGCTGHDEPEIDPVSSLPNSAKNLTWRIVLPTDGVFPVSATGFGFWVGGTVTDPHSLFKQSFLEVQFYPDTLVNRCAPNGNFFYTYARDTYTVCTPVWSIVGNNEPAHFNAMLRHSGGRGPLVMHAGDTILVHYYQTAARDGAHITVTDVTTHENGTVILNSRRFGPLMPAFSKQTIGNALGWGLVHDAPNSFVWEIGHRSIFARRPGAFCSPGHSGCESYNAPAWAGTSQIRIESVRFGNRGRARHWAVVSDYGGAAEITDPHESGSVCTHYGGPYCIYPWYSQNTDGSFSYGVDSSTTAADFGKANQFARKLLCGGPFGDNSTYCMTVIR